MANENNHGGKREGSGRKPAKHQAMAFVDELMAAERDSVEQGELSLAAKAIQLAKSDDKRVAASVLNKILDKLLVSKVESNETVTHSGPTIYLPEKRPEGEAVDIDKLREEARAEWAKDGELPH